MTWQSPQWLGLLLLPVGVGLILWWGRQQRRRRLERFVASPLADKLLLGPGEGFGKRSVLWVGASSFLVLALAGPTWGYRWEEIPRRGRDLYVLLDISKSMLAEDVSPNRLTWAKRKVLDLSALVPGDRIGLIAFSGDAFLACPLTSDSGALAVFLESLGPESSTAGGTAIARALDLAVERLSRVRSDKATVLLLTDGEDLDGGAEEAAARAAKAGITVSALGVGKPEGAPIPEGGGGFKKTPSGEMVLTRLDEATLRAVTTAGGGKYLRSIPGDGDLQAILSTLGGDAPGKEETGRRRHPEERFQWPLGLALLCLLLEAALQEGFRWKWRWGLALLLAAIPAQAAEVDGLYEKGKYEEAAKGLLDRQIHDPRDPRIPYDLGSAYYRMKRYEEAEKAFGEAGGKLQGAARGKALYNQGNAAFRKGDYGAAVQDYEGALRVSPQDEDTRVNLALAKKRLEEQKKQQQNQSQKQDQKQAQQNQDQGKDEQKKEAGGEPRKDKSAEAKTQASSQPRSGEQMNQQEAEAWLSRLREKRTAKQVK